MKAIQRLIEGMMDKYGIYVPLSEIGYESHLLYMTQYLMVVYLQKLHVFLEFYKGFITTKSASAIQMSIEKRIFYIIKQKY